MAKRRQTTGLPKVKQKEQPQAEATPSRNPFRMRETSSRAEREAEIQRLVILGTVVTLVVVLILVAASLIIDQVVNPNRTIASIDGETISVNEYQARVRLERVIAIARINDAINDTIEVSDQTFEEAANQVISFEPFNSLWNELNVADQLGLRVLNDMVEDQIVLAEAEERGIEVDDAAIDAEIEELFAFDREQIEELRELEAVEATAEATAESTAAAEATGEAEVTEAAADALAAADDETDATVTPTPLVSPTPTTEPSPTPTLDVSPTATLTSFPTAPPPPTRTADERVTVFEDTVDNLYSRARSAAGMSRAEVRDYFRLQALRDALSEVVVEPDTTETWVNSRHILVETEDEARDLIASLQEGASFAALARAAGTDGTAQQGGELGWAPVSGYVAEFGDYAREAPLFEINEEPLQTEFGFHVVQVRAREERDVEETQIEQNREEAFEEWLEEQRQSDEYDVDTSSIWPDFVPNDPPYQYRER